ncbi:ankyrin repeat domain-containing protein [Flavobacterium sp. LHD-85]|uniref:ankyrin repeat domain-containing protein n=1 Tax=Flavobacterium sp. LHD-85 TaxID=3071410 RepID=UPI0027DED670|nr:ankyrin repeat domain-containing protein [Flavobacterium sp. LHD-85]MDQ6530236.1 ankyrin repeat domain-containing protein [Flavobacterium sp. LHD-85]
MKLLVLALGLMLSSYQASPVENQKIEMTNERDILKAVKENNIDAVAKALKNGENVNLTDSHKRSLLLIATNNKNFEMAELLVKHGADVNQQADNLDSPFLYAGATGQTKLLKLFLANGARFDVFNRYNGSALIPACERGHIETVRLLANTKNYPINHVNRLGWTGLMEAIVLGDGTKKYQEIVKILKDAGAKMDIPDHDGVTPLQHAERAGYKEIAKIIKS